MKSLKSFRKFMTGYQVPNYVKRYCMRLDDHRWQWFYLQMKEPVGFVANIEYLFYTLKWILKSDFDDLAYEVYFQSIMNPEMRPEPLIKEEWWRILNKRYSERFENDISEISYDWNDLSVAQVVEEGPVIF